MDLALESDFKLARAPDLYDYLTICKRLGEEPTTFSGKRWSAVLYYFTMDVLNAEGRAARLKAATPKPPRPHR